MPRPRKDSGATPMREKIEQAFWECYTERPLEKISVKEICLAAGCNKTTFYYHFHDLREVLDAIEEQCLPIEAPDLLADLFTAQDKVAVVTRFIEQMGDRFERYCLLLGPNGDPTFANRAKETMLERWCEKTGIERASLTTEELMTFRFVVGGTSSVFADHGDGAPFDPEAFAAVILSTAVPLIAKVLQARADSLPQSQA